MLANPQYMILNHFKKTIGVALIFLSILGGLAAAVCCLEMPTEIRGHLSPVDAAEITRIHSSRCLMGSMRLYPRWCPIFLRRFFAAHLNPIEIIAIAKPGEVIIVYRQFGQPYYDKKGAHRGGIGSYALTEDDAGWHEHFIFP